MFPYDNRLLLFSPTFFFLPHSPIIFWSPGCLHSERDAPAYFKCILSQKRSENYNLTEQTNGTSFSTAAEGLMSTKHKDEEGREKKRAVWPTDLTWKQTWLIDLNNCGREILF